MVLKRIAVLLMVMLFLGISFTQADSKNFFTLSDFINDPSLLQEMLTDNNFDEIYISNFKPEINDGDGLDDINTIKFYGKIADHYNRLLALGDIISDLSDRFDIAFRNINSFNDLENYYRIYDKYFPKVIEDYNSMIDPTEKLIAEADKKGINIYNMRDILNHYYDSIEYYKKTGESLINFYENKNDDNFNEFSENEKDAYDASFKGREASLLGYQEYYRKIQMY